MSDNLKLATQEYVDNHSSESPIVGHYEIGQYDSSTFVVGPDNAGLKVSKSNYPYGSVEINGSEVKIENNYGYPSGKIEFGITVPVTDAQAYFNVAEHVPFQFWHGNNIVWEIDGYDGSLYVNGPVHFRKSIYDKAGKEITGGGGGSSFKFISEDPSCSTLNLGLGEDILRPASLIFIGEPGYTNELQTRGYSTRICAGVDTTDMWDTELDVDNKGVSIKTGYSGEYFQARPDKITIGGDVNGNITSVFVNGPTYFSKDIYDKDGNKITGGGGGGSSASKVWQVLFWGQGEITWGESANDLRNKLTAAGLSGAYLAGEKMYLIYDDWSVAEPKMFPITLLFSSPVTLEQLNAAGTHNLELMAATPMQTPIYQE